jgi:Ca2+-binding RTX toxin-like protein
MTSPIEFLLHAADQTSRQGKTGNGATPGETFLSFLDRFRGAIEPVEVDGGAGDDSITARGAAVRVSGGDGNDTIDARGWAVMVAGGAGNDVIVATGGRWETEDGGDVSPDDASGRCASCRRPDGIPLSMVSGGDGDDVITTTGLAGALSGGAGNDTINAVDGVVVVDGGSGDDVVTADHGFAFMYGGAGNDTLSSAFRGINAKVYAGAGDDVVVMSGRNMTLDGGTGNDRLELNQVEALVGVNFLTGRVFYDSSEVTGGLGDDELVFNGSAAVIRFHAGDGKDVIEGANEHSRLLLGPGLSAEDAAFAIDGDTLTLSFTSGDSITFRNYLTAGIPIVEFADGRSMDASTVIAKAGGNPDAYTGGDYLPPLPPEPPAATRATGRS